LILVIERKIEWREKGIKKSNEAKKWMTESEYFVRDSRGEMWKKVGMGLLTAAAGWMDGC
jgi:hypothetical protein